MKKILFIFAVLAVGYLGVGVCAWRVLPRKIAEAEHKRVGVSLALSKIANDQLTVSKRISEITAQTLDKGQDKAAQVSALLGDPTLNRMALTYMGADWAVPRSSFVGSVKHARDLLKMQKSDRKNYVSKLNKKIEDLEHQKRMLSRRLKAPSDRMYWRTQMDDVDRQLLAYRASNTYREYIEKDKIADNEIEAKARAEEIIYKLASDYEKQTVRQLVEIMTAQATALRYEEAEPERIKHQMSYFNIWPLNKMADMPTGE